MQDQGLTSRMLIGKSFAGEGAPVNPFFTPE